MTRSEMYASVLEHFALYFEATDAADFDEVLHILGGTAVVAGPMRLTDPDEIREAYAGRHPAPEPDGRRLVKNHATNLVLSGPDAEGAWTATMYYFRMEPGPGGAVVTTSQRIEQRIEQDGDRWRVLQHTIIKDF